MTYHFTASADDLQLAESRDFFERLWLRYIAVTPQAEKIEQSFKADGNCIIYDHVAFRTFDCEPINLISLEPLILSLGYSFFEEYFFPDKHLRARSYLPLEDGLLGRPRIFLSELLTKELSEPSALVIRSICSGIPPVNLSDFYRTELWPVISWPDYQMLLAESEYAAWLSVMGLCANHFTISINALQRPSIELVVEKLKCEGYSLNTVGGVIKGAKNSGLRQCSTLADTLNVVFSDGCSHSVHSCYYEFALRGLGGDGKLFQGFVPANANQIFHSTDTR